MSMIFEKVVLSVQPALHLLGLLQQPAENVHRYGKGKPAAVDRNRLDLAGGWGYYYRVVVTPSAFCFDWTSLVFWLLFPRHPVALHLRYPLRLPERL